MSVLLAFVLGALPLRAAWAEPLKNAVLSSVAILPIRNEADPYLSLSENSVSDTTRLLDFVRERMGKPPKNRDFLQAEGVREGIAFHLGRHLAQRGYRVYMGRQYDEFYRDLEGRGREITYRKLQSFIPADAFLLVVIDGWDAKGFDSDGTLEISYSAYLIDPKQTGKKGVVWSHQSRKTIELEPNDFLYRNRYEEIIRDIARVILSGLPSASR